MKKFVAISLLLCLAISGCRSQWLWWPGKKAPPVDEGFEPLPVQQRRAYPETVTGRFVSLCDFEDNPAGKGFDQVKHFSLTPTETAGYCKFVVNITRTGAGAMEAALPAKAKLNFAIPDIHDFTDYTLLSIALYSEALRDDLRITLKTDAASWTSNRTIVRAGWNNVLIDIQRLGKLKNFDSKAVRTMVLEFADAAGQVTFNVDDIMLIDNRRLIKPLPAGMELEKIGLDYVLTLGGRDNTRKLNIVQRPDGLWRMGMDQTLVSLAKAGKSPPRGREDMGLMGERKVGSLEILEHNTIRLRIANIWYFPTRAGEWASLAVRQLRWDYTFYGCDDGGSVVTQLELNNAGGNEIGAIRIQPPGKAAWTDGSVSREFVVDKFSGPVGRWEYFYAAGPNRNALYNQYINPGRIQRMLATEAYAPGDVGRDGFDESQGCYFVQATEAGHCRFTIIPPPGGLSRAVFRIAGPWKGKVHASAAGLAIRNIPRAAEGIFIFAIPQPIKHPTAVEVVGGN